MVNYKVPSPREIREKYQKPINKEGIVSYIFHRKISCFVTWALLHFTLSPHLISLMVPVIDLITVYAIMTNHLIWAAILTQIHIIGDCVDGEMGRFKNTVVKRTVQQKRYAPFMDSMSGTIAYPLVIFATGYILQGLVSATIGMLAFFLVVISSAYAGLYFPDKKKRGKNLRKKVFGTNKIVLGFNSTIQKSLITFSLLFNTIIFLWIFTAGAIFMTFFRLYIYRK